MRMRHRRVAVADGDRRQEHHRQVADRVLPERHVVDRRHPRRAGDRAGDVEHEQDRDDAEPERRRGDAADREHAHHEVDPGVLLQRRDRAERDGDQDGDHRRQHRDLQRDRQARQRSPATPACPTTSRCRSRTRKSPRRSRGTARSAAGRGRARRGTARAARGSKLPPPEPRRTTQMSPGIRRIRMNTSAAAPISVGITSSSALDDVAIHRLPQLSVPVGLLVAARCWTGPG